jgi:hypothetical protein
MENQIRTRLTTWKEQAQLWLVTKAKPLTDEQMPIYIKLSMNEDQMDSDTTFRRKIQSDSMGALVFSRSKAIGLDINHVVLAFIAGWLCENPAQAVMYLSYLRLVQIERKQVVNMLEFSSIFAEGFFDNDTLSDLWDLQKVRGEEYEWLRNSGAYQTDNLLDYLEFFK